MELNNILDLIKEGITPTQIVKKYQIPKSTLQYSLNKLKEMGCIEKKGYGVWNYIMEVPIQPKGSKIGQKEIRGHAFIWKVEFYKPFNWNNVINKYKKKLNFKKISRGKVYRTIFNNRKIWLTKKGIIIYEPLSFFGTSSLEVKGTAVFKMDKLLKGLLNEIGLKFRDYRFTTSREHYGIIRNELANQFNERKEKLHIKGEDGSAWLWIDNSLKLGELETNEPVVNRQVQKFWNDHKKTNFEVTPSFILDTMNGIQQNQLTFDRNMKLHIDILNKLGKAVEELTESVKNDNKKEI